MGPENPAGTSATTATAPGRKPNKFFGVYEQALPSGFCRGVIQRFDADPQARPGRYGDGTAGGAVNTNIKKATEIDLDGTHEGWRTEEKILMQSLGQYLRRYMQTWSRAFSCNLIHEPIKICRYPVGGYFDWHSDNMGSGVTTRVITIIWYLNTVEKGGETEYPWQNMSIPPVEGRMLICPVGWTYIHRSAPAVSEPKYIATTQLHQEASEKVTR